MAVSVETVRDGMCGPDETVAKSSNRYRATREEILDVCGESGPERWRWPAKPHADRADRYFCWSGTYLPTGSFPDKPTTRTETRAGFRTGFVVDELNSQSGGD